MQKNIILKTTIFYFLFLAIALFLINQFAIKNLFTASHFLNWDAEHYYYIKKHGYEGFRVAFFPLFPLIWKWLSLNQHGISIFNGLVFLSSFYVLVKSLKISDVKELLLYLSIPGFIFFFLPYTESLFFLSSTMMLLGFRNDKNWLVYFGLFLSILSRPAFTVLIPGLVITELLSNDKSRIYLKLISYFLVAIIGVVLVGLIQYSDTGKWFEFFTAQSGWGNQLQMPKFPLTSWAGGFIVKVDAVAFLIGTLAGGLLLAYILKLKSFANKTLPKEVIFSLAYLGGITLVVLLFRGGSLFSLNRFVFAVPFIIVVLNYWLHHEYSFKTAQLFKILGLIYVFWLLFGSYVHIQELLKFLLLSLYPLLLFCIKSDNIRFRNISLMVFILVNIAFQLIFYVRFLTGEWVG